MISQTVELLIPRLFLCLALVALPAFAQDAEPEEATPESAEIEVQPETSMRGILEAEEKAEQLVQEKE